jgi:shikimate dehydrogenase
MHITGHTRVFMILGDPVVQVRAPEVFNALFRQHGVDAVLVPAQVRSEHLDSFVRSVLQAGNIDGLWLTIPHKAPVLGLLDHCDPLGRVAGAVNAVRRNADGTVEGSLFDGQGFVKALDHWGIDAASQRVLLLGAGGAGMAIATSLAQRGVANLALFDASPERAAAVATRVAGEFDTPVSLPETNDPAGFSLIVNATPLGLQASDPLPVEVARLDPSACVVDILMTPRPTRLLQACHGRGITAHPGFEMLLRQMPDYLSFFGFDTMAAAVSANSDDARMLLQVG